MVVCQYYLQGRCSFGDRCRNEHPQDKGTISGPGFGGGSTSGGSSNNAPAFNHESMTKDFGSDKPLWPLSSYSPAKGDPNLLHGLDFSPEELRLEAVNALKINQIVQYRLYDDSKHSNLRKSKKLKMLIHKFEITSLIASHHIHAMCVRTLCWSPDDSLLVSGSDDRRLTIYDVRASPHSTSTKSTSGQGLVTSLTGHTSWVISSSITHDSRYLISGSSDRSIRVYDLSNLKSPSAVFNANLGNSGGEVWSVCWKPMPSPGSGASGWFFTGGEDGKGRFWRQAGVS